MSGDQQPCHDMYYLSSISSQSIRTWDQLNGETPDGNVHITKFNPLTESDVSQVIISMVNKAASAILMRPAS
jgi:hypothetical protein